MLFFTLFSFFSLLWRLQTKPLYGETQGQTRPRPRPRMDRTGQGRAGQGRTGQDKTHASVREGGACGRGGQKAPDAGSRTRKYRSPAPKKRQRAGTRCRCRCSRQSCLAAYLVPLRGPCMWSSFGLPSGAILVVFRQPRAPPKTAADCPELQPPTAASHSPSAGPPSA